MGMREMGSRREGGEEMEKEEVGVEGGGGGGGEAGVRGSGVRMHFGSSVTRSSS